MSFYSLKIFAVATAIDVELSDDEKVRFVKIPGHELRVITVANGAMTEFHYNDKAVSIRTNAAPSADPVTCEADLFVESTTSPITIYISGSHDNIRVKTAGDERKANTPTRTAYTLSLGAPIPLPPPTALNGE